MSKEDVAARGWDDLDVILITGDAYVDHPSFGAAAVGRIIEREGLRVAVVAQPNWRDDLRDFKKLGRPRLFFAVTAGCMDSMVNRYTAGRRLRSDDAYTPGGQGGFRPDYAVTVYTRILKQLYPDVPVMIGGIEASLRRVTHYDYWSDSIKPTVLEESGADLLVYGMGELPLEEMLRLLKKGVPFSSLRTIAQTAVMIPGEAPLPKNKNWEDFELFSHEDCLGDRAKYSMNFKNIETESNRVHARRLLQRVGERMLVINPPYPTMTESQIDRSFELPFTRMPHPRYRKRGVIPAYEMIKHSLNMHRGCFGGCSFCTISAHQGKFVASRSKESILKEAKAITEMPDFKGTISDLGGPSANMYRMKGIKQEICDACIRPSCIWPNICLNLDTDHRALTEVYRDVRKVPGVKHAFVTSGLRYDMFLHDKVSPEVKAGHEEYLEELLTHHVSGRLKVAPEHTSDRVLRVMRKPTFNYFYKLMERFEALKKKLGKPQMQLIPYFISSHPGSTPEDMADLAIKTKELGFKLEQVQDFTPTPMTVATEIWATGVHPYDGKEVPCVKTPEEKDAQRSFFFWYKPEMRSKIRTSLGRLGMGQLADRLLGGGPGAKGSGKNENQTAPKKGLGKKHPVLAPHKASGQGELRAPESGFERGANSASPENSGGRASGKPASKFVYRWKKHGK